MLPAESEPDLGKLKIKLPALNKVTITRILGALVVILLSVFIFSVRERVSEFAFFGYPGIFIISFMAYATVLLPAPGVAVVFTMGSLLNPLGVGIAAGAGAALGELSGYLLGISGQAVIERVDIYERLIEWMQKNGSLTVFLLSAIPNPFFDLAGAAAGALKMPLVKFLFWCWIGESLKMTLFAFSGAFSFSYFK